MFDRIKEDIAVVFDRDPAARSVIEGRGRLAFPGVVDAHMHTGIYSPMQEDAVTESRAAAQGGVTSSLNYFRTGQYYLNKGGPYRKFFPEVLKLAKGRFHVDYGFHLAPMELRRKSRAPGLVACQSLTSVGASLAVTRSEPSFSSVQENCGSGRLLSTAL